MRINPVDGIQIYHKSKNDVLYEMPPHVLGGFEKTSALLKDYPYDRKALVRILQEYNQGIGNECQAERLLDPSVFAFTTGQQPGFMGGPAYTILKAITCLIMAKRYDVPAIFWIASEDSDVDEVGKTFTIDEKGNLKRYRLNASSKGHTLDSLQMGKKAYHEIETFLQDMNLSFSIPKDGSYSHAMACLLAQSFKGQNLIFIEPKALQPLSKPFFTREIERADDILELIENEKKGNDLPFPKSGQTPLFLTSPDGLRKRLHKSQKGFFVDEEPITKDALLKERLTSSVMSRPILASSIIPTAGTILGPAEINYFLGLKNYFRFHSLVMPWIIPRISATVIPKEDADLLQGLDPASVIRNREGNVQRQILESGISGMNINKIENLLCPHGHLQERVLNWFYLQSKTSTNLIQALINSANPDDLRHILLYPDVTNG